MADWNPAANEIFLQAVEIGSPEKRHAYVESACAKNADLRRAVDALLKGHARGNGILDQSGATVAPSPDEAAPTKTELEKPGTIIGGRFKLLQKIGEGGMGAVWMADQLAPVKRRVALKVIKPGMDSGQVLARFEAERQALALMDHPNIAKVLDAGTSECGRPFFVMELVKGNAITKYCDEKGLNLRQRLELMIPVCHAIQHAHQKGIIHRDLKPSNVLIALYDGKPVPKVIDFGIAKAMGQQLTDKTLFTGFGGIVGTLEYMSPEQAELNQLDIDTRSDIYSLGVMLYELLTGSTPLERKQLQGGALLEILRLIREVEPPTPSTRLSTIETTAKGTSQTRTELIGRSKLIRGEVDWIVMKALEKDRNRRYETANSFAEDIRRFLKDEPVHAGPPSASYRLRKFVKRNAAAVAAAALVLLTLIVGMAGTSGGMVWALIAKGEAAQQKNEAQDQKERAVAAEADALDKAALAKAEAEIAKKARDHAQRLALAEEAARKEAQEFAIAEKKARDEADRLLNALAGAVDDLLKAAEAEKKARDQAEKNEQAAKVQSLRAEQGEEAARKNLLETQQTLFTAQIARSAGLWQSDPYQGKALLRDLDACPIQNRDFTWRLYHRMCDRERTVYAADSPRICATLSPDAKLLASGGTSGATYVWDAASGNLRHRLLQNPGTVYATQFSKDLKTLTTVEFQNVDKKTRLNRWDVASGELLSSKELDVPIRGATLHPDGNWLATFYYEIDPKQKDGNQRYYKGELILWNLQTGDRKVLMRDNPSGILCAAFSPDAKYLAAGTSFQVNVRLWLTETGADYATFRGSNRGWVHDITFTRDSKFLLFGSATQWIHHWDIAKKEELPPFTGGHAYDVQGAALSPNQRYLLSSDLHSIRLREFAGGFGAEHAGPFMHFPVTSSKTGADDGAMPLLFLPDGRSFIADKRNHLVRIDLPLQAEERIVRSHTDGITALAFSPDNSLLASVSKDKTARLCEVDTGKSMVIGNFPDQPTSVAFAPDGRTAFTGASLEVADKKRIGQIARFDVKTGKRLDPWLGHRLGVRALAVSPAHHLLASASFDAVKLWDLRMGREIAQLDAKLVQNARALCWHPTEKLLAVAEGNNQIKLWDLREMPFKTSITVSRPGVQQMAFTARGRYLVILDAQRNIVFTDVGAGFGKMEQWVPQTNGVTAFAITPDEKTLALGLANRTVQLWDLPSRQLRGTLTGHVLDVAALAFSPDGKMLASADNSYWESIYWKPAGAIKLWNARLERPVGHEIAPWSLQFAKDGSKLISETHQSRIVWDALRGEELTSARVSAGTSVFPSPDGRRFVYVESKAMWVVDAESRTELARMPPSTGGGVPTFCDENLVATFDRPKATNFWDLDTLKLVKSRPAVSHVPGHLSPNGRAYVYSKFFKETGAGPLVLRSFLQDLETGRETLLKFDSRDQAHAIAFAGNDRLLLSDTSTQTCKVWDLTAGKVNEAVSIPFPRFGNRFVVSANGQTIAIAGLTDERKSWQIRVWNLNDGKERCVPMTMPASAVIALALTADHHLAVATPDDTAVKFWPRVKLR